MAGHLPAPTSRPRAGRRLGGVCAGLAARRGLSVARVRLLFTLSALALGLGAVVYLAAWLILPGESEDGAGPGQRGIVLLAQACGSLLGLGTLAGAGAAATVFGFGWVVVGLAGAVLAGVLAGWGRLGPAWALLPVGALVLPSAALAMGGVHLEPSTTSARVAPDSYRELEREYRSGLGLLTLDLRRTELPERGTIDLKIDAGVRRTLIALPHDRCVHVKVVQHDVPVPLRVAALLLGEANLGTPAARIFGRTSAQPVSRREGPTLAIDFSTAGSELVVRDYPDDVDPRTNPDWPGYEVFPEDRPDTTALSRAQSRRVLRAWRVRRAEQERSQKRIDRLMGGPCTRRERRG